MASDAYFGPYTCTERSVDYGVRDRLARKLPSSMRSGWTLTYSPSHDVYSVKILDPGWTPRSKHLPNIRAVITEPASVFPSATIVAQMILVMG
jgi:hypothetical protein